MPNLKRQTARQRAHMSYMMDAMRRLEWDLHNTIELTGRIPEEWHQIAQATPSQPKVKVNLWLEADVVRFFKSMGTGYGPRINEVLKSYMHARLAGVIRGAETVDHYRNREEAHDGPKPAFGDLDRLAGETTPADPINPRARMQELMQARYGADGMPEGEAPRPVVR